MTTLHATVSTRLLAKASRLFTGSLAGRIIEILQNARRAGAKHVWIINRDCLVTVRDDGRGIDDFAKLLDLGGSGWQEELEASEDPAGVGLFCLAPRELTIRSNSKKITIASAGWTGAPVEVLPDRQPLSRCGKNIAAGTGTQLSFKDQPWPPDFVAPRAVFTGMQVYVDGRPCSCEPFIDGPGTEYPELGCRIQVIEESDRRLSCWPWHTVIDSTYRYSSAVVVNFHGQIVCFHYRPFDGYTLKFLVDLTGQPTGLRLMLPARTQMIENQALSQLKGVLEREAFLCVQRQPSHHLYYQDYLRAKTLGIDLPEAEPNYDVGLLSGSDPSPVPVQQHDDHPLGHCYLMGDDDSTSDYDVNATNAHLLAGLGRCSPPFVPVEIDLRYDGYSWAKLPTVQRIEVLVGDEIQADYIGSGQMICVKSIELAAHCSDGKVFRGAVPMAIKPGSDIDGEVYVRPDAREKLNDSQIWYHLGGFNDSGGADSYDTQESDFRRQLDEFWQRLQGPYEQLRAKLADCVADLKGWQSIILHPDGHVVLRLADGTEQVIRPPGQEGSA